MPQRLVIFTTSAESAYEGYAARLGSNWINVGHAIIDSSEATRLARTSFPTGLRERRWVSGEVHVVIAERSSKLPDQELDSLPRSDGDILLEGDVASEVALKLFGQSMRWPDMFISDNTKLFDKTYLPTQLAEDGDGVFFDERMVSSLYRIGAVPPDAQILRINDLGGWESIDRLDAYLRITFEVRGERRERMLIGSALVPSPPVTIAEWEGVLRKRRSLLETAGIPTNVLSIERAVLYALQPTRLIYIDSLEADDRDRVLQELGAVCRRLDEAENPLGGQDAVYGEDLIRVLGLLVDLGSMHAGRSSELGVLEFLGLVETRVAWADIRIPPLPYIGHSRSDSDSCYAALMGVQNDWGDRINEGYFKK